MSIPYSGLKIIRERFWFSHPTPSERKVTNEFTVKNETGANVKDIFLMDLPLMLGLEVFDEDGNRLPFLPNAEVKKILKESIKDKKLLAEFNLNYLGHKGSYFLWIKLPEKDKIEPDDFKIIRLKYYGKERPQIVSLLVSFFSLARYTTNIPKTTAQDYDIFVNILAPSGSTLDHRATAMEGNHTVTQIEGFYQSTLDGFVQIRIPNRNSDIVCNIAYDILPPKLDKRFVGLTLILLYAAASLLIFLTILEKFDFIGIPIAEVIKSVSDETILNSFKAMAKGILKNVFVISGGIIATSVAIAGLVRNPLFARVRWFYLGTTAIAIIAYLWNIG